MDFADGSHVQTTFFFYFDSQLATNVRTWKWVAGVTGQATNTAKIDAAFVTADIATIMNNLLSTGATMPGIRYVPSPNPSNLAPIYSTTVTTTGAGGAVALPKQTAGLCRFKSLTAGSKGENRIYVPFPPAALNDSTGKPSAGYLSNLLDLALLLGQPMVCDSVSGAAGTLVPTLNIRPGGAFPPDLIAAGVTAHSWATQRRRGDYGKVNKNPFA